MMYDNLFIGLVHHPVYNKNKEIVTTSITNLDIHDIARTCKTYGIRNYFIINPEKSQQDIFNKLKDTQIKIIPKTIPSAEAYPAWELFKSLSIFKTDTVVFPAGPPLVKAIGRPIT